MKLTIDGEEYEIKSVYSGVDLPLVVVVGSNREFYLAESSESAGKAARRRWEDMKRHDSREFRCLIGEKRLIQWACGESDSFGISNFEEFLDTVERVPEEEFGGYDGNELEVTKASHNLVEALGFVPTVAYRHN